MCPAAGRALMGLAVLVMISSGVGQGAAVAGGKMYWTDAGSSKIQRANLDGTGVEDLISRSSGGPVKDAGERYGIALTTGQ